MPAKESFSLLSYLVLPQTTGTSNHLFPRVLSLSSDYQISFTLYSQAQMLLCFLKSKGLLQYKCA